MGEEWRRDWHPENIDPKGSDSQILIVGAGPTGLEAARALGQRGYDVILAEASRKLGGRVNQESQLPGLAEWARVQDYRVTQIAEMPNVAVYLESNLAVNDILEIGADHVAIATGATWRRDGFGSYNTAPMQPLPPAKSTYTPDDIMSGHLPIGSTLVYDDDGFYMGSVIAEKLRKNGNPVIYLTPEPKVSSWSSNNAEQPRVHRHLVELGIEIILNHGLDTFDGEQAVLGCSYTGEQHKVSVDNIVVVTSRTAKDQLYYGVLEAIENNRPGAPKTVKRIGDAEAPAIIAAAIFAGHKYAREMDVAIDRDNPFKHDRVFFQDNQ